MMNREETNNTEFHSDILEEIHSTYIKKNSDYGDSFNKSLNKYGLISAAVRMNDKFERFDTLIVNEQQVHDESIDDTLLDLANYAIMTAMWVRQQRNSADDEIFGEEISLKPIAHWEKMMDNFGNFIDAVNDSGRKCEED